MRTIWLITLLQICFVPTIYADNEVILKLHGSNTIGAELGPALVRGWLLNQGYTDFRKNSLASEEMEIIARNKQGVEKNIEIFSHGSGTSFKSLKAGSADIGMSSRPIKEKENNRLKQFGDMTRIESEYVIGLDGIAVIVNKANPVSHLQKATIRDIFNGKITDWKQINNQFSGKIHVYARDNKSGTFDTFKALVLGKKTTLINNAKRYESNDQLSDDVSIDAFGIGFVGLPSVRSSKALAVAEQGALPKTPKNFEVATEDYALARRLYMYVPDMNANKHIQSFIDFCLSEQGQSIVDKTGFISQNLRAKPMKLDSGFPDEYLALTKKGERLSLNLRFKKGSTHLDNKAKRDLQRLVKFMSKEENSHRKIMLFGFAEASETLPVFSLDLSTYRVDWVSDLLVQHGIDPVRVRSYGDAIPVASNEDAGGRHKNRRVEVWLL